ncbi:Immunoglobulin Heavy Variable 2-5 [Manis pentadactyla]|nr:Immunoglobulin Heavy Variable 2-5 [Manis pentadactyla]
MQVQRSPPKNSARLHWTMAGRYNPQVKSLSIITADLTKYGRFYSFHDWYNSKIQQMSQPKAFAIKSIHYFYHLLNASPQLLLAKSPVSLETVTKVTFFRTAYCAGSFTLLPEWQLRSTFLFLVL